MNTRSNHNTQSAEELRRRQAVKRLPAPVAGVVVNVPLALLPLYMQLHGIEPMQYRIETRCLIVKKQEQT